MRHLALAALLLMTAGCGAPDQRGSATGRAQATVVVAPAAPAPEAPPQSLTEGLDRLDEAFRLRHRDDLREQVRPLAAEAAALLREARATGAPAAVAGAGLTVALALDAWEALGEAAAWSEGDALQVLQDARRTTAEALLGGLRPAGAHLPHARALATLLLLESGRPDEAGAELAAAFEAWPEAMELHRIARAQRDRLPGAADLAAVVERSAGPDPLSRAEAAATAGHLLLGAALRAEGAGRPDEAAALDEAGAAALARATAPGLSLGTEELALRRADCLVNAGRLHLDRGWRLLAAEGLPAAGPAFEAAERCYADALAAHPDDADALAGCAAAADAWFAAGDPAGARDAFARLARRFDVAEWWNNTAFLARETGQYEDSLAAYERCLALEPDNARYVNDTALILLYHLDRDLERAESMFERSIALGRRACGNPFIDDAAREENFLAYTDAMLNLALLRARDGRLDAATALLDELLALSPDREDARALLAQLHAARETASTRDAAPAAPRSP